jgi:hypothetical protein
MKIFPTITEARLFAVTHGNDAVEYRANSSEPWAVCSPICAWNPAPFEYRKEAGRWTIDAETAFGDVIRRTFSQEKIWAEAIKEYTGHHVTLFGGCHAAVRRIKIAKWKDVPRLTRVTRIDGNQFEFLGVTDGRAVLLRDFITSIVRFSDIKLSTMQRDLLTLQEGPGFFKRVHDAGLSVSFTNHTFRVLGLRTGWEMEQ